MKILAKTMEMVEPEKLIPYAGNWREHPQKQRRLLNDSMEETGYITPIIVNKRTMRVMDGHLRLEHAKIWGLKEIPVVFIDIPEKEEPKVLLYLDTVTREAKTKDEEWVKMSESLEIQSKELRKMIEQTRDKLEKVDGSQEDQIPKIKKRYNYILLVYKEPATYLNHLSKLTKKGTKSKTINLIDGENVKF